MKNFIKTSIAISSLLIILLFPVFFIVWQYNLFLPATPIVEIGELSDKEYRKYQESTLEFLLNKSELPQEMTELEKSHMQDVKTLVLASSFVLLFSFLIFLLFIFLSRKKKLLDQAWKGLKISSLITIFIIFLLILLSLFNFDALFLNFHEVFFPQGNWMFPADSLMVQVFPEALFKNLAVYSFTISFILAFFLYFISFYKIKKNK